MSLNPNLLGHAASARLRQAPSERTGAQLKRFGGPRPSPVDYYFYRDVFEELAFAASYQETVAYAVLTGGFGVTDGRGFVEVTGFESLLYASEEIDFTRHFRDVCRDIDRLPDGDVVVGLFCSAPGSEGIIPREAAFLHLSLFNIPFEPLLVIDPSNDLAVIYGRAPRRTFVDAPLSIVVPARKAAADTAHS